VILPAWSASWQNSPVQQSTGTLIN
jgi:hypothetical protein